MNSHDFDQTIDISDASNISITQFPDDEFADEATLGNVREVPAWAISLGVHIAVLALMASISTVTGILEPDVDIISEIEELEDELEYKFEATVLDQVGNMSDMNKLSPSQLASQNAGDQTEKEMEQQLEEEILTIEVPVTDAIEIPREAELLDDVEIQGQALDRPGGVEGAIDRMTWEIAGSLREKKTLVIWLFDESLSVQKRREAIAERFGNVYAQLGILKAKTNDGALKTAIAGFAEKTNIYTPEPITDPQKAVQIVRKIKTPNTAIENVFTAVELVTKKWLHYRTKMRHNVMIVIVTDERGDDFLKVEEVSHLVSKYGIRVYCIGNAAPFGREKGFVRVPSYEYPDGFVAENVLLELDQGPETIMAESLQMPFWGVRSGDLRTMTASYGPYALTRLCTESKGMFLVAQESSRGPRFDPAIMRDYSPDYRPVRDYMKDMERNMAKKMLVQAATLTFEGGVPTPAVEFNAETDNVLRQEVTEAQRPAAVFDAKLEQLLNILLAGEKDRKKVRELRWRAGYDLALGRVCAMRVRAFGYNVVLASMKASPKSFSKKGSNAWRLVPARDVNAGPVVRKLAKKAKEYLTHVIDDHPGTPWAMLAERELSTPMGWNWEEYQENSSQNGRAVTVNGKRILLANDEEIDPKTGKKRKKVYRPRPKG